MTDDSSRRLAVAHNKQLWDKLVPLHLDSDLYDVAGFKAGQNALGKLELEELGPVAGKRLCHLLCHFGIDTLSFARLGAEVTGYDLSDTALTAARALAKDCGLEARFVEGDIAEVGQKLSGPYDIVFMSWGVMGWISDLDRLAVDIARLLAPGGVFYIIEGHPLVNALSEDWKPEGGGPAFGYDYELPSDQTLIYTFEGYAAPTDDFADRRAFDWVHGLGRVVTAVAKAGLSVEFLHEHDKLAWQQLDCMVADGEGYWVMPETAPWLPVSFSLRAVKR
ncbi:MAG: class I SAM-dependent methyltransferase [Rhodospirillales bacterium]